MIVAGFLVAAAGCSLTALATRTGSAAQLIAGMCMTGAAGGAALLIRTAAGDMYPPERRARGIAYVLFGIGFGAVNPPITNAAVSGMPPAQAGVAAAIASTSRQVGASLGIAIVDG